MDQIQESPDESIFLLLVLISNNFHAQAIFGQPTGTNSAHCSELGYEKKYQTSKIKRYDPYAY